MRYVGALFTDNTNKYRLGGYTIWDAALSYKGDHMEYAANISNLFNKKNYFVGTIFNTQIYPGSDFGLSLTARFHF
jgi:iron complex outermembrane receptor protein